MPVFLNINGVWKEVNTPSINNNGEWIDLSSIEVNVNGVWTNVWSLIQYNYPNSYYIVTDVDNHTTINEALDRMTNGGNLVFTKGEWRLDKPLLVFYDNITISGVPNQTTLVNNSFNYSNNDYAIIEAYGNSSRRESEGSPNLKGLIIQDIILDGEYFDGDVDGIYVENLENLKIKRVSSKRNARGLYLFNIYNSEISECNFSLSLYAGLYIEMSRDIKFNNVICSNNNGNGMGLYDVNNSIIDSCYFSNNQYDGINYDLGSNSIIRNNTFQNNDGDGIFCYDLNKSLFTGNISQSNNNKGGQFTNFVHSSMSGNTFQHNSNGVQFNGSEFSNISNNNISYNDNDGLVISANNYDVIVLSNNVTYNRLSQITNNTSIRPAKVIYNNIT